MCKNCSTTQASHELLIIRTALVGALLLATALALAGFTVWQLWHG